MDNHANGEQDERPHGVPGQDAEPTMTEPMDRDPDPLDEPVVDAPVMDGAQQLRAEAAEAVASGEVDLTDTRHGGQAVVEEPPGRD